MSRIRQIFEGRDDGFAEEDRRRRLKQIERWGGVAKSAGLAAGELAEGGLKHLGDLAERDARDVVAGAAAVRGGGSIARGVGPDGPSLKATYNETPKGVAAGIVGNAEKLQDTKKSGNYLLDLPGRFVDDARQRARVPAESAIMAAVEGNRAKDLASEKDALGREWSAFQYKTGREDTAAKITREAEESKAKREAEKAKRDAEASDKAANRTWLSGEKEKDRKSRERAAALGRTRTPKGEKVPDRWERLRKERDAAVSERARLMQLRNSKTLEKSHAEKIDQRISLLDELIPRFEAELSREDGFNRGPTHTGRTEAPPAGAKAPAPAEKKGFMRSLWDSAMAEFGGEDDAGDVDEPSLPDAGVDDDEDADRRRGPRTALSEEDEDAVVLEGVDYNGDEGAAADDAGTDAEMRAMQDDQAQDAQLQSLYDSVDGEPVQAKIDDRVDALIANGATARDAFRAVMLDVSNVGIEKWGGG